VTINKIICCHNTNVFLYEDIKAFEQDILSFVNSHISIKYKVKSGILSVDFISVDEEGSVTHTYKPEQLVDFGKINELAVLSID